MNLRALVLLAPAALAQVTAPNASTVYKLK